MSAHGNPWFSYVDKEAELEQIQTLTREFLAIFERCPSRLKKKILQSHNDTKAQEDLRRKENTQNDQYRIDFGDGQSSIVSMQTQHNLSIQPGNPLAGPTGTTQPTKNPSGSGSSSAAASGSSSSSSGGSGSSNSSKYYHGKAQPKPEARGPPLKPDARGPPPAVSGQAGGKPPSHGSHSQMKGQPGYNRPSSGSKHGQEKGGRPESGHSRSQSHGSHQPGPDQQR